MKKLAEILVLVLVLTLAISCLVACGDTYTEGLKFTRQEDGSYAITGYTGDSTNVVIPSKYRGEDVTHIADEAFKCCDTITSVTIPSSIICIGAYAFYECDLLENVNIEPNSQLTSIGDEAFFYCIELGSIEIPSTVSSIGDWAFSNCDSLTSINIPQNVLNIGQCAFYRCSLLVSIDVDEANINYKSLDGNLYSKNGETLIQYAIGKTATHFTVPDGVKSIEYCSFGECKPLKFITIADSVTGIGSSAFSDCDSLEIVTFGENCQLNSIGNGAFANCDSLTRITIPDGVTSIEGAAFFSCDSLTIYSETTSQPSSWDGNWNILGYPVYWYSETEPMGEGNYWHYVDGVVTKW